MKKRRLKKNVKVVLVLFIIIVIGILLLYLNGIINNKNNKELNKEEKSTTTITTTTKKEEPKELSMVMVGDCLIHRFVYTDAKNNDGTYSFSKMFTEVEDLIKGHDLAFYNQESNIGGKELGLSA